MEGRRAVCVQVYAGPLQGGDRVVVLFIRHNPEYRYNNMTVTWEQLGYASDAEATVRDLYGERKLGTFTGAFVRAVC